MKYILAIVTGMFLFSSMAYGNTSYEREGPIEAHIKHFYKTETVQLTQTNRVCNERDIPIYSTKDKTGNIIIGSILGGIVGKQVGDDDGATALGAILGGAIANADAEKNKTIVGYKRVTVCEDNPTVTTEIRKVYSYSIIRFLVNGRYQNIKFIAELE
tara:strand:+ start:121 stop:594 length:474 start_codon:yes stop_codon:yes gene_type:complete